MGTLQSVVLSPLLFILYIDRFRVMKKGSYLVKFSDDTPFLSLLQDSKTDHGCGLTNFIKRYNGTSLDLSVDKRKEIIIDFRKSQQIHGKEPEIVNKYKYLALVFELTEAQLSNMDSK